MEDTETWDDIKLHSVIQQFHKKFGPTSNWINGVNQIKEEQQPQKRTKPFISHLPLNQIDNNFDVDIISSNRLDKGKKVVNRSNIDLDIISKNIPKPTKKATIEEDRPRQMPSNRSISSRSRKVVSVIKGRKIKDEA